MGTDRHGNTYYLDEGVRRCVCDGPKRDIPPEWVAWLMGGDLPTSVDNPTTGATPMASKPAGLEVGSRAWIRATLDESMAEMARISDAIGKIDAILARMRERETLATVSEVTVINMALSDLGMEDRITSMDGDTGVHAAARLRYPHARDAVLRAYDWRFAAARALLPADPEPPPFGMARSFTLPDDCLLVRSVGPDGGDMAWCVEGRAVVTDMPDPLPVTYTRRVDVTLFDPLALEALSARLASDMAVQLGHSVSRAQSLWGCYQAKLVEARRRDALEGSR